MDDIKKTISERINFLLKSNNLTQKALAYKCGLATAIINKATKGELSVNSALKISEKLGCSLDFLYGQSTAQSREHYAFEILQKHFQSYREVSFWNGSVVEAHISVSPELATYLDTVTNLQTAKINDSLREQGKENAKEEFLCVIEHPSESLKKYILLDANFYTDKVREVVDKAKEDMEGTLRE